MGRSPKVTIGRSLVTCRIRMTPLKQRHRLNAHWRHGSGLLGTQASRRRGRGRWEADFADCRRVDDPNTDDFVDCRRVGDLNTDDFGVFRRRSFVRDPKEALFAPGVLSATPQRGSFGSRSCVRGWISPKFGVWATSTQTISPLSGVGALSATPKRLFWLPEFCPRPPKRLFWLPESCPRPDFADCRRV